MRLDFRVSEIRRMATRRRSLLLLFVSAWLCGIAHGYFTNVDAHAEECFFDRVSSGMKMSLTFEVVEGGFLDIDVKVCVLIKLLIVLSSILVSVMKRRRVHMQCALIRMAIDCSDCITVIPQTCLHWQECPVVLLLLSLYVTRSLI